MSFLGFGSEIEICTLKPFNFLKDIHTILHNGENLLEQNVISEIHSHGFFKNERLPFQWFCLISKASSALFARKHGLCCNGAASERVYGHGSSVPMHNQILEKKMNYQFKRYFDFTPCKQSSYFKLTAPNIKHEYRLPNVSNSVS